ncbi:MOSC domain-containing protein [Ornithinimicrobium cerasi]|uniref:MOSC domain-containing protein YiiM n=1 Tax=Ornithinimicrobium cerasi TaxID=2248773 RepID=A0A285VEI2_9MICO|nr:MOSC domain-containing protein [Ornithinimicrobium cerasi]SOC52512.1 MOSC domain-containing protein YiiM [Ornithinimicrobium cerasi]
MTAHVRSTNLALPKPGPGRAGYRTGIDKRPADRVEVFAPGPHHGDGPGVVGDHVGNTQHHGGEHKAVYAFSREELDRWEVELQRGLSDGTFGENLTTEGIDLESLLINQRLRVGEDVVLEVSVPRTPCATFTAHLGERGWVRRFTDRGRCGAYFRVVAPGVVRAGDPVELLEPPDHDVDMLTAFAAAMGDDDAAARVVAARCLPAVHHEKLARRLGTRV